MSDEHQDVSSYTELWLIGTPYEVAALSYAAYATGAVVQQSQPRLMGGNDPRIRVYLRLSLHHR